MLKMKWWAVGFALGCSGDKDQDSAQTGPVDTQEAEDTSEEPGGSDDSDNPDDTGDSGESTATDAAAAVEEITTAAQALLDSLSQDEQGSMQFEMDDPARKTWSNLPVSMYPREGILTGDLDETQLALAYSLLEASLSSQGYTQALDIIAVDQWHRDRGDVLMGDDLYSISIFGDPSTKEPWSWQFDGHHLCFTFTVHSDQVSMSPSLWGVNPLTIPDGDIEGLRALGDEVDTAYALVDSFTPEQQAVAVIHETRSPGLLAGPGHDDYEIPDMALGLSVAEMSESQKELLLSIVQTYVLDMEDTHAALRLAEIEEGVNDLHFAWMGPTEFGAESYYRIYGPTVLIELDHNNGNDHIHAVYRNPANDYGEGILAEHYARYPH